MIRESWKTNSKIHFMAWLRFFSLIIILLFTLPIINHFNNNSTEPELQLFEKDQSLIDLNFSNIPVDEHAVGTRYGGGIWNLTEELEYTMDIKKGSDFYIKISPQSKEGQRLSLKQELNPEKLLTTKALSALNQVPRWLHENLTNKFVDLAQKRINLADDANAAFGDLNGDGVLDLVCGSLENGLLYYKNQGTISEPIFIEDKTIFKFNPDEISLMSVYPAIGDIDSDGDLDILIGNENGDFIIVVNEGSSNNPIFNITYSMIGVLNGYSSPCLGDIDNDNDLDIISGNEDGRIYVFENSGDLDYSWMTVPASVEFIDIGSRSKPCLMDLDSDGDLDLTIGEDQAIVNYYRNDGSITNPTWRLDNTIYLGLPVVAQTSPTLVDLNGDRRQDLVVGCTNGLLYNFENIGTGTEPQWQIWSTYKVWPGIEYYDTIEYIRYFDENFLDTFANLIIDADINQKDEVAFSIAHTATQVLHNPSTTPELYKRNAELLYEIDQYIDYADIIDYGSINDNDYYSTVRYKYKEKNSSILQTTELPFEIYYWYIVHPKITDEIPAYINPDTGEPTSAPLGRFWREYLFYYNDTEYPPDPPTDPNDDGIPNFHYPKEESPPLLKEKLSGIKYVYDTQPYNAPRGYNNQGYNNTRPWDYKDHAIEIVSNWVAKTLPLNEQESADGERPIQPVRIAHHHNGNCGELQDLTIAAARTALIPATGILLFAEDHVWSEFYDRGWHQWDNYWSDGGSVVDNFMNYWVGWGQRGGSGLTKWHGDDSVSDVTSYYVPEKDLSTITVHVIDRNGYPVDGARVMLGSHWLTGQASGYQATIPYPSVWNYTDTNGSCTFKVATQEGLPDGNKNFSFKVISKLGNDEQGKTELVHGEDYETWFMLEGSKPEPYLDYNTPSVYESPHRFMLMLYYNELKSSQEPPNPLVGNYHPQSVGQGREIEFYLFNESNFDYYCKSNYNSDEPVSCIKIENNHGDPEIFIAYELLDNDEWYLVGYNKNSIETSKKVWVKIVLYEQSDELPEIRIIEPKMGATFQVGDKVKFSGYATDDRGIERIILSIKDERIDITGNLVGNNWSYIWDTTDYADGNYTIYVWAYDTNNNGVGLPVKIILIPPPPPDSTPPNITIESPVNGSAFIIGSEVRLTGKAYDDDENGLATLTLSLNSKSIDLLPYIEDTTWSYVWDSTDKNANKYTFNIRGTDKAGNLARISGYFELIEEYVDHNPPIIILENPKPGASFNAGLKVIITGTLEDDLGVSKLELSIDYQDWIDITSSISGSTFLYIWDTQSTNTQVGEHIITLQAFDEAGNSEDIYEIITILDVTPPEISIDIVNDQPMFNPGADVELKGEVFDDVGINKIEIQIIGGDELIKITRGITIDDNTWRYTWSIPLDQKPDVYIITATAWDIDGNSEFTGTEVNILAKESDEDSGGGFLGMPGFESGISTITFIFIATFLKYLQLTNKRIRKH